jgi:hypothetical protein
LATAFQIACRTPAKITARAGIRGNAWFTNPPHPTDAIAGRDLALA